MDFANGIEDVIVEEEGFFVNLIPGDNIEVFLGEEEVVGSVVAGGDFGAVEGDVGLGLARRDGFVATDGDVGVGMVGTGVEFFDVVGADSIVAVYETEVISGGGEDSAIAGSGEAGVFLVDDCNAGILLGVGTDEFAGIVGRTVVDDDDFEVFIGLFYDGLEAGGDVILDVVGGDDN